MNIKEKLDVSTHYFASDKRNMDSVFVEKKWGSEFIISDQPHAAKIMTLKPNTQVSMHFHREKSETFILIKGAMVVEVVDLKIGKNTKIILEKPYSSITLPVDTPHTFYCPSGQTEETVFIEASTEDQTHDNYRLYASRGESPDNRRSNN